jgi:hypothetical protein
MVRRSQGRPGDEGEGLPLTRITSTREGDLTVFQVRGDAVPSVLLDAFREFLEDPTRLVLWDMRGCAVARLDHDKLRSLVSQVKKSDHSRRPRGKSAFVCRSDEDRNVARLFVAYAQVIGFEEESAVFGNVTQARHWLAAD